MERKTKIIGMALFAIKDGVECGNVAQLVIDADAKRVTHLVFGSGKGFLGTNTALPIEKLIGVGRDFMTTNELGDLVPVWKIGENLSNSLCDCDLIGLRVLGSAGNVEGAIEDFAFDYKTGEISAFFMAGGITVDAQSVITISQKGIFVSQDNNAPVREAVPKPAASTSIAPPPAGPSPVAQAESIADKREPAVEAPAAAKGDNDPVDYFVKKQSEYLIGRKTKKDIHDTGGRLLIHSGDVVTAESVEKIRLAGKLTELMLHVE